MNKEEFNKLNQLDRIEYHLKAKSIDDIKYVPLWVFFCVFFFGFYMFSFAFTSGHYGDAWFELWFKLGRGTMWLSVYYLFVAFIINIYLIIKKNKVYRKLNLEYQTIIETNKIKREINGKKR